jgi:hypothetical protein
MVWADYGFPDACDVDPVSGDLAVSEFTNPEGDAGAVTVFASPLHADYYLKPAGMWECLSVAYDDRGNLNADGYADSSSVVARLARGALAFRTIHLHGKGFRGLGTLGGMQRNGRFVTISVGAASQGYSYIYRFSGSVVAGVTLLQDAPAGGQYTIFGKAAKQKIIEASQTPSQLQTYAYPAGQLPTKRFAVPKGSYDVLLTQTSK